MQEYVLLTNINLYEGKMLYTDIILLSCKCIKEEFSFRNN